jgi:uncharacterized C2H2 Zn-finger protein
MVFYKCNKCNKEFNRKSNYTSHINRKFFCNKNSITNTDNLVIENIITNETISVSESPVIDKQIYKCETCHKEFNKKSNYTSHINRKKTCNNEIVSELKNYKNEYFNLLIKYEELQNKFIDLNKNNITNNTTNNTINNHNNITTNNTINITLTNFGNEKYTKLTNDEQIRILKSNKQCISNLIKFLHINDRLPEYKNICVKNLRGKGGYLYEGNKWLHCNFENLLMILFKNKINDLEKILNSNEGLISYNNNYIHNLIENYTDDMDTFIKNNKDNIINMLYNNTKNYKI